MSDNSRAAFEEAYEKFRREHVNASFMPKDMALAIWQACEKRLLLSKVQLPERKIIKEIDEYACRTEDPELAFEEGFNECLDSIKLAPLDIFPSDEELMKRNEKYVKANKSSKNTFDCLDFAYYHGHLDFIDDLKSNIKLTPLTSEHFPSYGVIALNIAEMGDCEFMDWLRDFISKRLAGM